MYKGENVGNEIHGVILEVVSNHHSDGIYCCHRYGCAGYNIVLVVIQCNSLQIHINHSLKRPLSGVK